MALKEVRLNVGEGRLPSSVADFLQEAESRIDAWTRSQTVRINAFVPSDFVAVYHALQAIVDADLSPGDLFCEWGSGFGISAMLASMMDFQAYGIEIESSLVEAARSLASDFDLSTEFVQGSFVPSGAEILAEHTRTDENVWLVTDVDDAYPELGLVIRDFDLIYAFPWPGEEDVMATIFDNYSSAGALLLTFTQLNGIRLRRKVLR
jgi:hypothetical protein